LTQTVHKGKVDSVSAHFVIHERRLLRAARGGDERAFRRLIEPHREQLRAHCLRMLGSVHDADDAVQETLLRAWRGLDRFDGRSGLRPWLHRIARNACLDMLKRRSKGLPPIAIAPDDDHASAPDPVISTAASYEQRESVELAVAAAVQHLPGTQRAALVLGDVLGFTARESADLLDTTPASVYSAAQRARKVVDQRLPPPTEQPAPSTSGDARLKAVVERYMRAIERADVDEIVSLLSEDAGKIAA
jgi:RNA polymerase sigma-70 factor (ECF subfamily)